LKHKGNKRERKKRDGRKKGLAVIDIYNQREKWPRNKDLDLLYSISSETR
jgi:hypothetical protein